MLNKILKYKIYLDKYNDCPSKDFKEISGEFCRWVSAEGKENDFKPLNLITEPPQRLLDDSDKLCVGYGLSFFDKAERAFDRYSELYRKQKRAHLKELFKKDKGTCIALIEIGYNDGLANDPNFNNGHFTFHEYEAINLYEKITKKIDIFADDGSINIQI